MESELSNQNQFLPQQPKSNELSMWIILLIVISMFGMIGLLAYQNYQLKQQLTSLQSKLITPKISAYNSTKPSKSISLPTSQPTSIAETTLLKTEIINDEISNPKYYEGTVNNGQSRFSFNYRSDLVFSNSSENNIFFLETPRYAPAKPEEYQIQVSIFYNGSAPTPSEYMTLPPGSPDNDFISSQTKSITDNGTTIVTRTYNDEHKRPHHENYYMYKDGVGIIIQGTGQDSSIIDEVVSTFKFM